MSQSGTIVCFILNKTEPLVKCTETCSLVWCNTFPQNTLITEPWQSHSMSKARTISHKAILSWCFPYVGNLSRNAFSGATQSVPIHIKLIRIYSDILIWSQSTLDKSHFNSSPTPELAQFSSGFRSHPNPKHYLEIIKSCFQRASLTEETRTCFPVNTLTICFQGNPAQCCMPTFGAGKELWENALERKH